MKLRTLFLFCLNLFFLASGLGVAQNSAPLKNYHTMEQVVSLLSEWTNKYPGITKLISIGKSAGQHDLTILRIAAQTKNQEDPDYRPAIFVCANLEGVHLIGTEAALHLAEKLLGNYGSDKKITALLDHKTIYIMPLMNPDATVNFLSSPYFLSYSNDKPFDEDFDGKLDEDPPEDLNKDGFITKMRVKDPKGQWRRDSHDARLLRRITKNSGDLERYSLFTEGGDDDDDGSYNEDPKGGIELFRNFPYSFEYNLPRANIWPDSTNETASLITFLVGRPNISLVLSYSLENTFLDFPKTKTGGMEKKKIKLPDNFATSLGLDPGKQYLLNDLVNIIKNSRLAPNSEIDETTVASLLGLSPIDSIAPLDLRFIASIQNEYKKELDSNNLFFTIGRINGQVKGSFLSYCYFHLGVPVFSSNVYAIPKNRIETEFNSNDPDSYFLKLSDQFLDGEGFIEWQPFKHPELGDVEIGGFNPLLKYNPPLDLLEQSISFHTDFYINLMTHLAELRIKETNVRRLSADQYKITVHFFNPGWFPTATVYGSKRLNSLPIIVRLKISKEQMLYAGENFEVIDLIGERGKTKTLEWTIKGKKGSKIILTAESAKIGLLRSEIELN